MTIPHGRPQSTTAPIVGNVIVAAGAGPIARGKTARRLAI
jgi:hypothetical protein